MCSGGIKSITNGRGGISLPLRICKRDLGLNKKGLEDGAGGVGGWGGIRCAGDGCHSRSSWRLDHSPAEDAALLQL